MAKANAASFQRTGKSIFFALLYGLLSAIAINDFLNVTNSYSVGVLGVYLCMAGIWIPVYLVFGSSGPIEHCLFRNYSNHGTRQGPAY